MKRRCPYIVLSTLFFLQIAGGLCLAATPEKSPVKQIESYQKRILTLQGDIAVQQGLEKKEDLRADQILAEIETLDNRLIKHQIQLRKLLTESKEQEEKIARQEAELKSLEIKRDKAWGHLQKRGTALYTMGRIGLINATFSSKTLPDLLNLKNAFDTLLQHDKKVFSAYEHTLDLRRRGQRALKLENVVRAQLIEQVKEEEQQVLRAKEERLTRLEQIRKQKKLRRQAIEELHNASAKLTDSIARIKDDVILQQKKFHASKGTLPMPVEGGVVATKFRQKTANAFGEKQRCNGIEIQSPEGAEVIAVGDGKVFFAGYLQGYGNTIIINHGMHYYSVTSRLEEINVKKGTRVNQGDRIALAGESATLFTKGVYFEIRKQKQHLNPLNWLEPKQLKFAK